MGQTQSGVISIDELSSRVMGAAVVLLSSQLDTELTFKSVGQIKPTDTHVLPLLTDSPETNPSVEKLAALYSDYYAHEKVEHIDKYITEHITDSEEHLNAFISLLINSLRKKPQNYYAGAPAASVHHSASQSKVVPASSIRSKKIEGAPSLRSKAASGIQESLSLVTPAKSENSVHRTQIAPVKGSNKLQKRMHALDQAIDAERLISERVNKIKQNIDASYKSQEEGEEEACEEAGEELAIAVNITENTPVEVTGGDSADDFEHV